MNLDHFVERFAAQLDETDPATVNADTKFRELAEWSSLAALSVIALIDEEYDVRIKGDDIREAVTVRDLYEAVKSQK